jgi:hypothetical protein
MFNGYICAKCGKTISGGEAILSFPAPSVEEFLCRNCNLPDPHGHHAVAEEIAQLLDRKRADYGSENIKKFGSQGVLVRVSDKVERLINLSKKGQDEVNFELKEDSWKDMAGYSLLALLELREGR